MRVVLEQSGEKAVASGVVKKSSAQAAASSGDHAGSRGLSRGGLLSSALRVEWLGQTVASLCWIGSVLCYGVESAGDYLQICAALAWLIANVATLVSAQEE